MMHPKRPARTAPPKLVEKLEGRLLLTSYYVSTAGDNANPGTSIDAPLRTIQQAVDTAMPGDIVLVRGGTYRETVTTPRSGTALARITIRNYENEVVTVSGTDVITGAWTSVGNEVYRAPMPWNYQFENQNTTAYNSNQVFVNGQMTELARWPNQTSGDLILPTNAIADTITFSKSDPALVKNDLATFNDAAFTDDPARWVGAKIWVNLSRNGRDGQGQTGTVVGAANGSITVTGIDTRGGDVAWGIGTGTEYYLFQPTLTALNNTGGVAAGLDRGEWFLDTAAQQLYVRTPTGSAPASGSVEAKRRTYGFSLDGDNYINLLGIGLFATSLTIDNLAAQRNVSPGGVATAGNILIDSMNARYVTHFTDQTGNYQMQWLQKSGLILSGTNIVFQNGDVRYSAGSGLSMFGRQGKVLNSMFSNLNYSVSEAGAVNFGKTYDVGNGMVISEDHEFAYNTVRYSPQQGINFRALKNSTNDPNDVRARIHHNVVNDVMLRAFDSAAMDSFGVNHQYLRIDHNVIYNVRGGSNFGIYFDFASGGIVDHNLIYNVTRPINTNWDPATGNQNMRILNNVAISDIAGATVLDANGGISGGSIIRNNILSGSIFTPGGATVSNNLVASDALFVDATNADMAARNYQLVSTAGTAIDKGISVAPYDDPLADGPDADEIAQPDIGAYERGLAPWAAGAGRVTVPVSWIIGGVAYRDGNRNGKRDAGEVALAGRRIYLDVNNNGVYDLGTSRTFVSTDVPKPIPDYNGTTNSPGIATSTITVPANSGVIAAMTVTINVDHTYDADLVGYLVAPDGTSIKLMDRVGGSGNNFTNTVFDDAASVAIGGGAASAPFTGTFRPSVALAAMNGKDAAGVWTLRIEDGAGADVGTINAFSIQYGTTGDAATTTAGDGSYAFYNLGSGSYNVRQVVPSGWSAVSPAGSYVVQMTAGTSALDRDFGSYQDATPTVATAASATAPTSAGLVTLSVLGADPNGEANLSYSWSTLARPTGAALPTFIANSGNAAKTAEVTLTTPGTYTFRATIVNATGDAVTSDVDVTVQVPPQLTGFAINDGAAQRSMVTSLKLTFDRPVALATGALALARQGGGAVVQLLASPSSGPATVHIVTFAGAGTMGGSLLDGLYKLTVTAGGVTDAVGLAMAGTDREYDFHRYFGDADGDRDVDGTDSRAFRSALGSFSGQTAYRTWFDIEGDGDIDGTDSRAFRSRLGTTL